MAQPENFAILHPLVAATLWLTARGLKGDGRSFALAGLLAGLATLARNDGVLLAGAIGLVWLADRLRALRARRGARVVEPRRRSAADLGRSPASAALGLFLVVMGPWWARQLAVFGSISPTSLERRRALDPGHLASGTRSPPTRRSQTLPRPGLGPDHRVAARRACLDAIGNFVVMIAQRRAGAVPADRGARAPATRRDFGPWFVYTFVAFAGATFLYPLHVPGGAFIHTAIGLAPHAAILSIEGVLLVRRLARRPAAGAGSRARAGRSFVWGIVALVVATAVIFTRPVHAGWDATRQPRIALAGEARAARRASRRPPPVDRRRRV